jgi:hypothetical protein
MFKLFLCIFLFLSASGISRDWNHHLTIQENCELCIVEIEQEMAELLMKETIKPGDEYKFIFLCGKKCAYHEVFKHVK